MSAGYTMLESADEYAREWAGANNWYITRRVEPDPTHFIYRGVQCDYPGPGVLACMCTGGVPMIKPNCPRHGHLTRAS